MRNELSAKKALDKMGKDANRALLKRRKVAEAAQRASEKREKSTKCAHAMGKKDLAQIERAESMVRIEALAREAASRYRLDTCSSEKGVRKRDCRGRLRRWPALASLEVVASIVAEVVFSVPAPCASVRN